MLDLGSRLGDSRAARGLVLAFGAAFLIALPQQAAHAQLPPLDPCLADPAGCLPDVPELPPPPDVDPCLEDPASCLPPAPDGDECSNDPSGCLPPAPSPDVDKCAQDPSGCLPPEVDGCEKDPEACAPQQPRVDRCAEDVTRCLADDDEADEDQGGALAPGERNEPPPQSADAASRTGDEAGAATGTDQAPFAPGTGSKMGTGAPSITEAGGILGQIGGGLTDAARRFAFPLALAGMAGMFLLIQGLLDRGDPKLTAAPVDARDDLVLFQ